MNRGARVGKMRDLIGFLVDSFAKGQVVTIDAAIQYVGARGRILEITGNASGVSFSDDTNQYLSGKP